MLQSDLNCQIIKRIDNKQDLNRNPKIFQIDSKNSNLTENHTARHTRKQATHNNTYTLRPPINGPPEECQQAGLAVHILSGRGPNTALNTPVYMHYVCYFLVSIGDKN